MGTISSNIGLISGFPILDTVDKLVALSAAPRDALTATNKKLTDRQVAFTSLAAMLTGLQITSSKLKGNLLYAEQNVTSSNTGLVSVNTAGRVQQGSYQFTPIRQVQTQRFTSSRIASATTALGGGKPLLRFGGFIDPATSIDLLNGGEGFDRGKIQIVDRGGNSAIVDLSLARSIDDVIGAINAASGLRVTARAEGDHIRLVDTSGLSTTNLQVHEVDDGTTAASLGLANINVAAASANGSDILRVFNELSLSLLSAKTGVRFDNALDDLQIQFRDGSTATVDFHRLGVTGTRAFGATQGTLDENAKLKFTATQPGSAFAGVQVIFQDDDAIVAGSNETVAYDEQAKTLTFRIAAGETTASDVIEALKRNPVVSPKFTAAKATGASGEGLVSVDDTATLNGPPSTAVSLGTNGPNAKIAFTAVQGGAAMDDFAIQFLDNPLVEAGSEVVFYDADSKQLIVQIDEGNTTADNVIAAIQADPIASAAFTAVRASGSNGQGLVSALDTATTAGGALIEPIAATNEATLSDVLATLNSVAPGKLQAAIGPDGKRLVLTDLTTDNGSTFSVTDLNGSRAALDLGLAQDASGDTITGGRLLGGLKSSLVRNLGGGLDTSPLGLLALTDRSGATANVDLSAAETVEDVIDAINAAGLGLVASVNQARDGIQLTDTTGSTSSHLIVANGDATNTADRLQIAIDAATTSKGSGNLKLRLVSENTTLASLNGSRGVAQGTLTITDTLGTTRTAHIGVGQVTLGDVINELNSLGLAIHARINDAGDGIALVDTAHGSGTLQVTAGNSTAAADLHLLADATTETIDSQPTQVISGSTTFSVSSSATDTLTDLVNKINDAKIGVTASIFNDGSIVKPFRLILTSQVAGTAGELRIDASQLPFTLSETVAAQDALLQVEAPGTAGLLASSSTNVFENVLAGARLTINGTSQTPVTITASPTSATLSATLSSIIDAYNKIHDKLSDLTSFDATSGQGALLQGDSFALRLEQELAELFTRRMFGLGSVQTLEELGISVTSSGSLSFDQAAFDKRFTADPAAVEKYFTTEKTGFAARIKTIIDQLAGPGDSLLTHRSGALGQTIDSNQQRIDRLTLHLETMRLQLLTSFYRSESLIAKIRNNLGALAAINVSAFASSGSNSTSIAI